MITVTGRCSLTFLPIREPGISKRCEACNREYLDESSLLRSTAEPTDADRSKVVESGSRLQSPVSDGNAAGNDPQDHDIRADDEVTIPAPPRLEVTKSIFAEFDVCPFCRGKYVG